MDTGIYIHWPYCDRICPYCDFNVARNREVDSKRWIDVLREDISYWREVSGPRTLSSIYFGGGTPSLMPLPVLKEVMDHIGRAFSLTGDVEVTLEANPTDVEVAQYRPWRDLGINRVSIGVQSFDDAQLQFLGRNHDSQTARRGLEEALDVFGNVTFDLIYGLPNETPDRWAERIAEAAGIGAPHISAYQLTVEQGTAFAKAVDRGAWSPLDADDFALFDCLAHDELAAYGYDGYEVSSYARPGSEAVHNQLYWTGGDWIGIGPSAAGRLTLSQSRLETTGTRAISQFLALDREARYEQSTLTPDAVALERLAGGLRTRAGVPRSGLEPDVWSKITPIADRLRRDGFLQDRRDALCVSDKGRLLIDAILRELVAPI